jgi:phosphatidate cytidylyltransferase
VGSLIQRILVAVVAIPLLLFVTFWDNTFLFKAVAVIGLGLAFLEYLRLVERDKKKPLQAEGFVSLLLLLLPWFLRPWATWGTGASMLMAFGVLTFSFMRSQRPLREMLTSVSVTFFGVAYFGILGGYFFRLREMPEGAWHLVWLYAATWAYDTGGYFAGHWWGRRLLAPQVSPKKTWEGCLGGWVLVTGGLFLLWSTVPFYSRTYRWMDVLILSLLLSFFGQMGDLVESVIKRSLSAKDSGSLLPGHGGIFDRIDSLLFNAPVLFFYLTLFKL